jgi:hypothetical protein
MNTDGMLPEVIKRLTFWEESNGGKQDYLHASSNRT